MAASELSPSEARVLEIVVEYITAHGYPPTVRDVQHRGGFPSSSSTYRVLDSLRAKRMLEWQPQVTRTIRPVKN
jgi:repressor LexA